MVHDTSAHKKHMRIDEHVNVSNTIPSPRNTCVSPLVYPILLHLSLLFSRDSLFTSYVLHVAPVIVISPCNPAITIPLLPPSCFPPVYFETGEKGKSKIERNRRKCIRVVRWPRILVITREKFKFNLKFKLDFIENSFIIKLSLSLAS